MELSDYQALPDYMEPSAVERYCRLIILEAEQESFSKTLAKLREMADRQWHTYELPPAEFQDELKHWLISNWIDNTDEYLEAILFLGHHFGLDKDIFKKALTHYGGKFKEQYQLDFDHSAGELIDPWWRLKPAKNGPIFVERI